MKILVIQGPNLNLLGRREPEVYGAESLDSLHASLIHYGKERGVVVEAKQSNHEGEIIDYLHQADGLYDGIILNAGAYTHYSYAIRDAIAAISVPVVEVHISNIYKREEFRHQSVIAPVVTGQITGLGTYGYRAALDYLREVVHSTQRKDSQ
jgi:3-dehydroquinate dehydratase-2